MEFGGLFRRVRVAAVALGAFALPAAAPDPLAGSGALWRVVHDLCVVDQKVSGLPAPCVAVDLVRGYAVLTDPGRATQLLLVPTRRLAGIESPALLAPDAPNYWQAAWDARRIFERRVGRQVPREDLGLAVNSVDGRTQSQLHIHIDCVRPDVREALKANEARIGARWSDLPLDLAGRRYRVMRLEGAELGARDPFKLLAADPRAAADMRLETLAVIGAVLARGRPGFVLLSDHADLARGDTAAAEGLLDHHCAVLAGP